MKDLNNSHNYVFYLIQCFKTYSGPSFFLSLVVDCRPFDLCFILDTSVSVSPSEWDDLRRFVITLIGTLSIGPLDTQIGIITYSDKASVSATLGEFPTLDAVTDCIWNNVAHLNRSTRTPLGLDLATTKCFGTTGDRAGYDNLAMLFTDGRSATDVVESSKRLRDVAKVVAMGIDLANEDQLKTIVDYDDSLWFKVPTFDDLRGQVTTLLQASCGGYHSFLFDFLKAFLMYSSLLIYLECLCVCFRSLFSTAVQKQWPLPWKCENWHFQVRVHTRLDRPNLCR